MITKDDIEEVQRIARKSYKFRLYPNQEQTANLERSLDLCRELYN